MTWSDGLWDNIPILLQSVRIYSRLSLKLMVTGHRGNQISCRGKEMFVGSNLVLQWVPGSGKVVRGDTKMSPGRVSLGVLQRGVGEPAYMLSKYQSVVQFRGMKVLSGQYCFN